MTIEHLRCNRCNCHWDYGASQVIYKYEFHISGVELGKHPPGGILNGMINPREWIGYLCDHCFIAITGELAFKKWLANCRCTVCKPRTPTMVDLDAKARELQDSIFACSRNLDRYAKWQEDERKRMANCEAELAAVRAERMKCPAPETAPG